MAVLVVCGVGAAVHHFAVAQTPPIHPRLFLNQREHVAALSSLFSDATFRRQLKDESKRGVGRGQFFVGDRSFQGSFEFGVPNLISGPGSIPNPGVPTSRQSPTPTGLSFRVDASSRTTATSIGARLVGSDYNLLIADPRGVDFLPEAIAFATNTLEAEFLQGYAIHQIISFRRPGIAIAECTVLFRLSSPWDTRYVMVSGRDLRTSFSSLRIVTGG
ncbi:MAG: hypothetical protein AAF488_05960 [Planctomycetota bacterium]